MPTKIIFFTKYSRNGASSRLRSFQYIDKLKEEEGIDVTVQPLFSEKYIELLYQNKSTKKEAIKGYFKRLFFLFTLLKYNKIIIEKELFPYIPAVFEKFISLIGISFFVDYDDAIFHNYDQNKNKLIRILLKNKIKTVMKSAKIVMVGNEYLAQYAQIAKAKSIVIIPTVIDVDRYSVKNYNANEVLTIGWIGTPKTIRLLEGNLKYIENNLNHNFKLITIGGKLKTKLPYEFIPWTENTEVENISRLDVGIMPLLDSDFEKGKCGYKLIQYMACGIPVIASAVGVNNEIVTETENGFLVKNNDDWHKHINYFINNPEEIVRMGKNARKTVVNKYTLQVQYPIIKKLLRV